MKSNPWVAQTPSQLTQKMRLLNTREDT